MNSIGRIPGSPEHPKHSARSGGLKNPKKITLSSTPAAFNGDVQASQKALMQTFEETNPLGKKDLKDMTDKPPLGKQVRYPEKNIPHNRAS